MRDANQSIHNSRKREDLEIHSVEDQIAVYEPAADRLHYLNPTAALVLELCDGTRSAAEIAALLQEAYELPDAPLDVVDDCLRNFTELGIVR